MLTLMFTSVSHPAAGRSSSNHPAKAQQLFVLVRARPDAIVRRLSVHRGPRNAFDLANYVVNDGQLFCAGGEVGSESFCW
jgi:hypothetical protein